MAELMVEVEGVWLTFVQASQLARRIGEIKRAGGRCHWHVNECGCCVSLHGHDCAYLIGADGEETLFPGRGCGCPEDHDG